MKRMLVVSFAAFCLIPAGALAQTQSGSMSSPMSSSQGTMSQSSGQMSGPMASGQMGQQPTKKSKKSHAAMDNSPATGGMTGPGSNGAMSSPATSSQGSMSTPH